MFSDRRGNEMSTILKPALVLGSGFHRHVFASDNGELPTNRACLSDWNRLIDEVADRMHVARPSKVMSPIMRWEALIENASRDGFRSAANRWHQNGRSPVHRIEAHARRQTAKALEEASKDYPRSRRAQLPAKSQW